MCSGRASGAAPVVAPVTIAPEATTLLEAIGNAMAVPDAGLRGFASKCMAEFMKWAIKQSAPAYVGGGSKSKSKCTLN